MISTCPILISKNSPVNFLLKALKEYLIEAHFYVKGRFKLHVPDYVKSSSIPFHFGLVLRSKCIYRKKLNVKTLSGPYTKRKHPRVHSKMCHLAMADEQSHGVKLGNSKIANYNSSRMMASSMDHSALGQLPFPMHHSQPIYIIQRDQKSFFGSEEVVVRDRV